MLILSRQVNETILIGDDIEVMLVSIKGNQVQLGITAPRNVPVHRSEVYAEKVQERRAEDERIRKASREAALDLSRPDRFEQE